MIHLWLYQLNLLGFPFYFINYCFYTYEDLFYCPMVKNHTHTRTHILQYRRGSEKIHTKGLKIVVLCRWDCQWFCFAFCFLLVWNFIFYSEHITMKHMQIIFKIMLHLREYELLSQKRSQILSLERKRFVYSKDHWWSWHT